MSRGIYIRTDEIKRKKSEAMKGNKNAKGNKNCLGHHCSEETKRKLSEIQKGKPNPNKGYRHSEEAKKEMSEARRGEKNYNWKGGMKLSRIRTRSKRRGFDFIPLNAPKKGDIFHHIDKTYGIYMPEIEHRSIWHNQFTGQGMDEMNALAFNHLIIGG